MYENLADLLTDPVLGKLEEVRALDAGSIDWRLYAAALLEVANARGTCDCCDYWRLYSVQEAFGPPCGTCSQGVSVVGLDDTSADFGCSFWQRRGT